MATYRDAGVDIAAGNETVRRITPLVRRTFTPGVLTDIGAFGGFFALNPGDYQQPVLVSSIDGVGTKLKVAAMAGRHDTVGEDLVNHCVNDIAVCGARPLFFLDYYATGTLHPDVAYDVISGFTRGCEANGCALIGGETAEMPGIYSGDDYDLAGCVVGVVERGGIVKGDQIRAGDVLVGLPSTGLHTNGYSLARKVLFERFGVHDRPDALGGQSLADALLAVHRSYLQPIQTLIGSGLARGFSHVTGGGIEGNTSRILPDGLGLSVDYAAWDRPALFRLIQEVGEVPESDAREAFNLGIGLVAVVAAPDAEAAMQVWREASERPVRIGHVTADASGAAVNDKSAAA